MNPKITEFWNDYKARNDVGHDEFLLAEFGDSPELADRLADLIRRGIKTATCSSYQDYADGKEILPAVGALCIVLDSQGDPVCIYRVTEIRIGAFDSADAAFAFDEGEDDRTLESWAQAHRRFFGLPAMADAEVERSFQLVFERFQLVWPLDQYVYSGCVITHPALDAQAVPSPVKP